MESAIIAVEKDEVAVQVRKHQDDCFKTIDSTLEMAGIEEATPDMYQTAHNTWLLIRITQLDMKINELEAKLAK